jgi:hypothetical protein
MKLLRQREATGAVDSDVLLSFVPILNGVPAQYRRSFMLNVPNSVVDYELNPGSAMYVHFLSLQPLRSQRTSRIRCIGGVVSMESEESVTV